MRMRRPLKVSRESILHQFVGLLPPLSSQLMKLLFKFRCEMHFHEFEIRVDHRRCQVPARLYVATVARNRFLHLKMQCFAASRSVEIG